MIRSSIAKAAAVAALSFAAVTATATTAAAQVGRINFTGSADVGDQPGSGGANLLVDFLSGNPPTVPGGTTGTLITSEVINGQFDLAPVIMPGMSATITDLVFAGPSGTLSSGVLTVGAYTFTFVGDGTGNTFGPISLIPVGSGTAAIFGVTGNVTGGAFGAGAGFTGVFSAQFSGQSPSDVLNAIQSGQTLPVGISAEFNVVPEPSTYMLLASGIAGLGLVARRRRTQV